MHLKNANKTAINPLDQFPFKAIQFRTEGFVNAGTKTLTKLAMHQARKVTSLPPWTVANLIKTNLRASLTIDLTPNF